jgi:hypothetical protein
MNIFNCNLEAVERTLPLYIEPQPRNSQLRFSFTIPSEAAKNAKNVLDEMFFIIIQLLVPVNKILRQVNFFSSPETSLRFFIELPDVVVL